MAPKPLDTNPMAHGTIELGDNKSALRVTSGQVDIFAINDTGVRLPLATLKAGEYAFGCAGPEKIIAVPRQGGAAQLEPHVDLNYSDLRGSFAQSVARDLGADEHEILGEINNPKKFAQALGELIRVARARNLESRGLVTAASKSAANTLFDRAMRRISSAIITLRNPIESGSQSEFVAVLKIIGATQGFSVVEPPEEAMRTSSDLLRLISHASGVRYRPVVFRKNWQEGSQSIFLAHLGGEEGTSSPVALMPGARGYRYQRPDEPGSSALTPEIEARLEPSGYEFYSPIAPDRPALPRDMLTMAMQGAGGQWLLATAMALGVALLGLLTPVLTHFIIGSVVPSGEGGVLPQVGAALFLAATCAFVFSIVQNLAVSAISQRATRTVQASMWDRVLSLPAGFFRNFSSGDLAMRVLAVDSLQALVSGQVVSAILAAVFGTVNLALMFSYSLPLGLVGTFFVAATVAILWLGAGAMSRYATESLTAGREANGWLVQMLQGVMKIRLANAEKQFEARYFDIARTQSTAMARQTMIIGRLQGWFVFATSGAVSLFYLVLLLQWKGDSAPLTTAEFMAFTSAFGLTFAAVAGLSALISPIANAGPTFNLLQPLMDAIPETGGGRQDPGLLSGKIELRDVHFRYTPDGPFILKGLNVSIEPGTMVALVGPSGAGKSTITRLLLGFDVAERGQVFYDGRDLGDLDPTLVRSQMGVVVQEGRITRGSIIRNILGATSHDENLAWQAAESAALAEDIRKMPMGMQTMVDPGNVSGGQAQRILLARSLVHHPSILILDEATSALDNASQKTVTEAMVALKATRIVIAHRLSTIRSADRIIVLEAGTVAESGTYEELMAKDGVFKALVNRQVA